MDSSFQSVDGFSSSEEKVVINDLEIRNLERHHNGAVLTCRAVNNIRAPAAVASVKILMHCKYFGIHLGTLGYFKVLRDTLKYFDVL